MKKIAIVLTLAVVLVFVATSLVQSKPPPDSQGISDTPIWQITLEPPNGDKAVDWVDHLDNNRFAIYDFGTEVLTDDVVLDKETGLVWQRSPSGIVTGWNLAMVNAFQLELGGRKGWRLPTIEELCTLWERQDQTTPTPFLPTGHPFVNVAPSGAYFTSTTDPNNPDNALSVSFHQLYCVGSTSKIAVAFMWCVRGGQGHDALVGAPPPPPPPS